MMQGICEKITDFIVKNITGEQVDRVIVRYGIELFLSDLLNVFVVLVISLLFGHIVLGMLYFLTFAIMREQTGGYHAKTHLGCNLVLGINTALVMTAVRFFGNNLKAAWGLLIISAALGLITFILFAPREHENKKLEQYSKDILKKRSIIVWLIVSVVQIVLLICGRTEYAVSVGLSMISVSLALLV